MQGLIFQVRQFIFSSSLLSVDTFQNQDFIRTDFITVCDCIYRSCILVAFSFASFSVVIYVF